MVRELLQENTRLSQEDADLKGKLAELTSRGAESVGAAVVRRELMLYPSPKWMVFTLGLTCLTFLLCFCCMCEVSDWTLCCAGFCKPDDVLCGDKFSRLFVLSIAVVNCFMLKLLWLSGVFESKVNEFIMYVVMSIGLVSLMVLLNLSFYSRRKKALLKFYSKNGYDFERMEELWSKAMVSRKAGFEKREVYEA